MRQRARQAAHTQKMAGQAAASRERGVAEERRKITSTASLGAVLALAKYAYVLDYEGIHGPQHWLRVLANGRELARRTPEADLAVIECFALLHDCKREDDGADPYHGERAAQYVATLADRLPLSAAQLAVLIEAISGHENGDVSDDPTIGVCWDADRLELSRLFRAPIAELLSTPAALHPGLQKAAWRRGTRNTVESL